MLKKISMVLTILPLVIILALFGVSRADVSAATSFTLSDNNTTLTITSNIDDYKNVNDRPWQANKDTIRTVIISDGVTKIGDNAFAGMGIKSVTIPNTVTSIGDYAFCDCTDLRGTVVIPDSVTTMGQAFSSCSSMTGIKLSSNLTAISDYTFSNCSSLAEVNIPSSVKSIGKLAFAGCEKLKVTFNEGLETIGDQAFNKTFPTAPLGLINEELNFPDSLVSIGEGAFAGNSYIKKVTFGSNMETIGSSAFLDCKNLAAADMSKAIKLKTIGKKAFQSSGLTSINIPDNVEKVDEYAFSYCEKATSLKLPNGIKTILPYSFRGLAITELEIPSSVTTIDKYAFENNYELKKIVIPSNVLNVNSFSFRLERWEDECVTSIDISNPNLVIGGSVFKNRNIFHVHIPDDYNASEFFSATGWEDTSVYFNVGSDGICHAAYCPFRDGDVILGDVNGDGKINNTDIITLGRAYMANDTAKYIASADMNGDGQINNADIIMLGRRYMSGQ